MIAIRHIHSIPSLFRRWSFALGASLLLLTASAFGQPIDEAILPLLADTTQRSQNPNDLDIISLGLEFVPSPGEGSFLEEYRKLGGRTTKLDGYVMPSVSLRLASSSALRFTISGSYAHSEFTDIYGVVDTVGTGGAASLVEEFKSSAIPVSVGVEYAPVRTQFTTYVGAAVGASFNTVEWLTTVRQQTPGEFRRPSLNTRGSGFFPMFRFYTGVDYRFDRNLWSTTPVRGIFLEGSYLVLPVRRDYFAAIRNQGRGLPEVPSEDSGSLNLGGFTFTIGVNLQFVRR